MKEIKNSLFVLALVIAVMVSGVSGYIGGSIRPAFTVTATRNTTSTYTLCNSTEPLPSGCYRFFNSTFTIGVAYDGPWGVTYQSYLGSNESSPPAQSGSFYGHGPASETVRVSGPVSSIATLCIHAEKLDASSSILILRINPPSNVANQTALPYGVVKVCVGQNK